MDEPEWSAEDLDSGGNWDSLILGSIATNLTQLKTWDQTIKELVQNADDANATEISFDVNDTGLIVTNNQRLTYCNFPKDSYRHCDFKSQTKNDYCDAHAIKTLSSQNKKKNSETTGKFGIGFVSIFLFTDQPTISSGNLRMTFLPAQGTVPVKIVPEKQQGTVLTLPWALNPDSPVRLGLEKPAIQLNQIPGIVSEIIQSCVRSFLFVKNLKEIRVSLNSNTKLLLNRVENDHEIVITDRLTGESTSWLLLKSDKNSSAKLEALKNINPNFASRRTEFEILIPRVSSASFEGLLYATLATNQRTYLPLHINADFFPDTSRNNLSFHDRGNEQDPAALWNRSVIFESAKFLASNISNIQDLIGNAVVWDLLKGSYLIAKRRTNDLLPECFDYFWREVHVAARESKILENQSGALCLPTEISILNPHKEEHQSILNTLGIFYQRRTSALDIEICMEIGSIEINQNRIFNSLKVRESLGNLEEILLTENNLECLYSLIESTFKRESVLIDELSKIPIWLTSENRFFNLEVLRRISSTHNAELFADIFPMIKIASSKFLGYANLYQEIALVTGDYLVTILSQDEGQQFMSSNFFKADSVQAFEFLFKCISCAHLREDSKERLKRIPFWPHSSGSHTNLLNSTLPGSFTDPIGVGQLLDREKLGQATSSILIQFLGVKELSLDVYVLDLLPTYFASQLLDAQQAYLLLLQFSDHQKSLSPQALQRIKDFPFVVCRSGLVLRPTDCLYPVESIQKVCSEKHFNYVDSDSHSSLNASESAQLKEFLKLSGVIFEVTFDLLIQSWLSLQENSVERSLEISRFTEIAEGFLNLWQKQGRNARPLLGNASLSALLWPCTENCGVWHSTAQLIQNRWSKTLCAAEGIHSVGLSFSRRSSDLIEEVFGIRSKPLIRDIHTHLAHCVATSKHPGETFYKYLNWLAKEGDSFDLQEISNLRNSELIFHEGIFWVPRDIYLEIPRNLEFMAAYVLYVDSIPKGLELLWDALAIGTLSEKDIARYFLRMKADIREDVQPNNALTNYMKALSTIGNAFTSGESWALDYLNEFQTENNLLTFSGAWVKPELGVIADNDEWANALKDEYASSLVRVESAAYEFLIAAGSKRLTEALKVHEESLEISGSPDAQLTRSFQERSDEIYALLANQIIDSPGGSMQLYENTVQKLERIQSLKINPVASIQVRVTLDISGRFESREISNAPPLYLSKSNSVIYVRNGKEPILSVFTAILYEFIPKLTSDQILDSASKFLVIMKIEQAELMAWLKNNGFLKHDISIKKRADLMPTRLKLNNAPEEGEDASDEEVDFDRTASLDGEKELPAYSPVESEDADVNDLRIPSDSLKNDGSERESSQRTLENQRPDSTANFGKNAQTLKDLLKASDSSGSDKYTSNQSEIESGSSSANRSRSGGQNQSNHGRRRRSGFAHVEAEKGDGLGNVHNSEVDKAGIAWVKAKEWEIHRSVTDMNETERNHKGFDLISVSDVDRNDIRLIEVKSCAGSWPELGVGLSRAQFEISILKGFQSWMYVVENALEPDDKKRLHRIQNPWDNIRSVYFDPGWRDLAIASPHQNPISLVKGLRVRHIDSRLGWIASDPKWQGQTVQCLVLFDDNSTEELITWNEDIIEVVMSDDD